MVKKPCTAFLRANAPHSHKLAGAEKHRQSCTSHKATRASIFHSLKKGGSQQQGGPHHKQKEIEHRGQRRVQRGWDISWSAPCSTDTAKREQSSVHKHCSKHFIGLTHHCKRKTRRITHLLAWSSRSHTMLPSNP